MSDEDAPRPTAQTDDEDGPSAPHVSIGAERLATLTQGASSWVKRRMWPLAGSVILALALAWLLHKGALPVIPRRAAFTDTRAWAVASYGGVWIVLQVVRAARWQLLLAPLGKVPLGRVIRVGLIGYAVLVTLPFRMGEAARPALIRRHGGIGLLAATGTIGAERIVDGLFLSLLLMGALLLSTPVSPLPSHIGDLSVPAAVVPGAAMFAAVTFLVLFVAMAAFYFFRSTARACTLSVLGLVSERFALRTAEVVERLASGLSFLARPRASVPFVVLTGLYWFGYAAGAWLLLWGTGVDTLAYVEVLVICGVLAVGVIVPSAPGFFGSFQISLYAGMVMFLPLDAVVGPGAAFIFVFYVTQLVITLLMGIVAGIVERNSL